MTTQYFRLEKIPWTEKAASFQSMGSQRVGHDGVTKHAAQHSILVYGCITVCFTIHLLTDI